MPLELMSVSLAPSAHHCVHPSVTVLPTHDFVSIFDSVINIDGIMLTL